MPNGIGVSVAKVGKGKDARWRVRWRELVRRADGSTVSTQKERRVSSEAAAVELRSAVLRALETGSVWQEEARPLDPAPAEESSLDAVAAGWLRSRAARGLSDGTLRKYTSDLVRIMATVRRAERIPEGSAIPARVLNKPLIHVLVLRWRDQGLSEASVYNTARVLLDIWDHGADDEDTYPGVPRAPRDRDSVLPRPPMYAAPVAPTLDECDACLRHIPGHAYVALGVAIVARYTGLRVSQILSLTRDDLTDECVVVRTGKTRREKAQPRTLPVHPAMVADLNARELLAPAGSPSLLRRRADLRAGTVQEQHHPSDTLREAWRSATEAGACREEVWRPANRELARPLHAFRAALQAHLVRAGVPAEVVDALVGHAGSVRTRHYAGDAERFEAMRAAVLAMPAVRWVVDDDVVPLPVAMRRR